MLQTLAEFSNQTLSQAFKFLLNYLSQSGEVVIYSRPWYFLLHRLIEWRLSATEVGSGTITVTYRGPHAVVQSRGHRLALIRRAEI